MAKKGPARSDERRNFWQTAIELQQQSGISIRKFCQQEGLAESAFYFWRRALTKHDNATPPSSTPKFVPVNIKPTSDQSTSSAPLVIELTSGTKLSVNEGCSPELLKTTLETLWC